ncbi:MAG TPA: DNA topoisomerase IV subunit A, partial [Paenalcaligenes sp.]|nr:DNA topoisomerase IV subunit A [Paenalcaligenes sp.]
QIEHMVIGTQDQRFVLGVENGYGFIAQQLDMLTRQRAGKQFMNVHDQEQLLKPLYLQPDDTRLALLTEKGRFLVIELDELRTLKGGGRGTMLMSLDADDRLIQWAGVGPLGVQIRGIYRRRDYTWVFDEKEIEPYLGRRARKGKVLTRKIRNPELTRVSLPDEAG